PLQWPTAVARAATRSVGSARRDTEFTMVPRHAGVVASGAMARGAMLLLVVLVSPWAARAEQHWKAVGRVPPGAPRAIGGRNVLIGANPATGAGVIRAYDLNTGAFRVELAAPDSGEYAGLTSFAAAGDTLMAVEPRQLLHLFDLRTGGLFRTLSADGDDA